MQICGDLPLSKTLEIATTRLMVGTSMSMMLWNVRRSIKCQLQDTIILQVQPDGWAPIRGKSAFRQKRDARYTLYAEEV